MSRGLDSVAVLASVMEENRRSLGIIPEPCSRLFPQYFNPV